MTQAKCEEIQPNLLDYGKGLLTGPEAEEIGSHVRTCSECEALLAEEMDFAGRLGSIPDEQPVNDVWALIRAETTPRRRWQLMRLFGAASAKLRAAAALAVAVAVLFVVITAFWPSDQPAPMQPQRSVTANVKWSDDPLGNHADTTIEVINNM